MAEPKNYITPLGYARLRDEQDTLRLVERPHIVDEVARAAAMGDRSENAEYIYGKRRLRQIDRRLRFLDKRIEAAEIVDPSFGATVTLGYPDGSEREVQLVGQDEIEPEKARISWRSPLGRVLMRRQEGDEVILNHADARTSIEILEVAYVPQESGGD
jgi:transcription elongation factor GreB